MGRPSSRRELALAPLLILVVLEASAAARTASETAYRDARATYERGEVKIAAQKVAAALAVHTAPDDDWHWALRELQGEVLLSSGRPNDAFAILSAELPTRLRTSETEIRRLSMLAYVHNALGKERAAIPALLERARKLAAEHHPDRLVDVYFTIGNLGERDAQVPAGQEALRLARKAGDPKTELRALSRLAFATGRRGDFAEAVHWGEQALALAKKLKLEADEQSALGNLGWAYFELGDLEVAAEFLERANALAARQQLSQRINWINMLGNIYYLRHDYARAAAAYREALALARSGERGDAGVFLANLARVSVENRRYDEAHRYNAEALALKKRAGDADGVLRSDIIEARILAATGKSAEAEARLKRVAASGTQAWTRWEARGRLAQLYAETKRTAAADAEYRRALDTARQARQTIKDSELRLAFHTTFADVFASYLDFLVEANRVDEALAATENQRAQTLQEGLENTVARPKVDPRAAAKQAGATILSYWLGRERSYLWIVTPRDVTLRILPGQARISSAVERYARELLGVHGTLEASGRRGEELYKMLVEPAGPIARDSRVVIVPDGRLHSLNFETLVVPGQRRYWIEDVVVLTAGSIQLLGRETARPDTPRLLLVGNPPQVDPAFPRLEFAGEEAAAVARRFSSRVVLDRDNATPAAYRGAPLRTFDFIHFVAHGVSTTRKPLDSAVILNRDATNNYRLLARDIIKRPLSARLVTISSCYGAGTREYAGEGLVGLAWAFLHAGADQVVAALWQVNDRAAPRLMDRMYEGILVENLDPATALRKAKLTMVRASGVHRSPRYWAPFVLYSGS